MCIFEINIWVLVRDEAKISLNRQVLPSLWRGVPILGYNAPYTSGENETMSVEGNTTMVYYSIDHPDPGNNFTVMPMLVIYQLLGIA